MSPVEAAAALVIVLLLSGWWLSWLATRVDRAHHRVERAWAALDAALVRRAQRVAEIAGSPGLDPASALLLSDAATTALEPDLAPAEREQVESDLSHLLGLIDPARIGAEQDRAALGRRLYNDAVATACALRQRRTVRVFRLAGHAQAPRTFEMADPGKLVWPP